MPPSTIWLTAKRDFSVRIRGSEIMTSLDGLHFDEKPAAAGDISTRRRTGTRGRPPGEPARNYPGARQAMKASTLRSPQIAFTLLVSLSACKAHGAPLALSLAYWVAYVGHAVALDHGWVAEDGWRAVEE